MKRLFIILSVFISAFVQAQTIPQKQITGLTSDLLGKQRWHWFNVLDYGADSTGTSDNSAAFTAAIAAMPTYGGTLFVPKGRYKFTSGFTVDKRIKILGEGGGVHTGFFSISQLFTETDGITLITVTRAGFHMEGIGMEYRSKTTAIITGATSGRALHFTNADEDFEKSFRLKDCSFRDFYDNVDVEESANWHITSCTFTSAERYNLRIRNVSEPDGGDWTIDGQTYFYQYGSDSGGIGIYQESSGGGKISNVKFNGSFQHGYFGDFPEGAPITSIVQFSNCSFENIYSAAIYIKNYEYLTVTGCEFGPYTSISSGIIDLTNVEGATITGNVFVGNSGPSNIPIATDADCSNIRVTGNVYTDFVDPTPNALLGTNVTEDAGGGGGGGLDNPATIGTGVGGAALRFNYEGEYNGSFLGQMEGVNQMSGGFANDAGGGVGTLWETSGRNFYIYDHVGTAYRFFINSDGSLKIPAYASGTTITGTANKFLAVDTDGKIIAVDGSGGSSQWTDVTGGINYGGGKVGIGGTPDFPLHIQSGAGGGVSPGLMIENTTDDFAGFELKSNGTKWAFSKRNSGGGNALKYYYHNGTSYSEQFSLTSGGAMTLPAYGAGTATFDGSGNLSSSSDERLKNIQGKFTPGLSAIMKINPIRYKWNAKSGMETKGEYAGFSAQNVKAAIPLATGENKDGTLTLQDRALMAALVNAVKEQQEQIETLKKEIAELKRK